jgi:hypothetical protein
MSSLYFAQKMEGEVAVEEEELQLVSPSLYFSYQIVSK